LQIINYKIFEPMKKRHLFVLVFLFGFSLLLLNSCYTKKKGIVPCPGHGSVQIEKTTNSILSFNKV